MKFNKEIKIGLLALFSGSILYFGFNFLKGTDFLSTNKTYYVRYDKINGLTESNQVLVNGFGVGRVSSLTINQGLKTNILVAIDVSSDVKVGKDAIAILTDTDLLGGKSIDLIPGDINNLAMDGDTIIGINDKSLPEIFADKAMPVVEQLDSTIHNINEFFKSYTFASKEIQEMFIQAKLMVANSQSIVIENKANLLAISGNLKATTDEFKKSSQDITMIMNNLKQVSDSLTKIEINRTLESVNRNLETLDSITNQIASGEGTLGKMVYNDSLYNNLNSASKNLDLLLIDLKAKPKRYVNFSVFGKKDK